MKAQALKTLLKKALLTPVQAIVVGNAQTGNGTLAFTVLLGAAAAAGVGVKYQSMSSQQQALKSTLQGAASQEHALDITSMIENYIAYGAITISPPVADVSGQFPVVAIDSDKIELGTDIKFRKNSPSLPARLVFIMPNGTSDTKDDYVNANFVSYKPSEGTAKVVIYTGQGAETKPVVTLKVKIKKLLLDPDPIPSVPVFRLRNDVSKGFFYTANKDERDFAIRNGYTNAGPVFRVMPAPVPGTVPFFRLRQKTGDAVYFYTSSPNTKANLMESGSWAFEKRVGYVYEQAGPDTEPIYRLKLDGSPKRFYTTSAQEKTNMIQNPDTQWKFETIDGYAPKK